nr:hypothetical protein Iba_chr14aCG17680 [Ipomoea batatas]
MVLCTSAFFPRSFLHWPILRPIQNLDKIDSNNANERQVYFTLSCQWLLEQATGEFSPFQP